MRGRGRCRAASTPHHVPPPHPDPHAKPTGQNHQNGKPGATQGTLRGFFCKPARDRPGTAGSYSEASLTRRSGLLFARFPGKGARLNAPCPAGPLGDTPRWADSSPAGQKREKLLSTCELEEQGHPGSPAPAAPGPFLPPDPAGGRQGRAPRRAALPRSPAPPAGSPTSPWRSLRGEERSAPLRSAALRSATRDAGGQVRGPAQAGRGRAAPAAAPVKML